MCECSNLKHIRLDSLASEVHKLTPRIANSIYGYLFVMALHVLTWGEELAKVITPRKVEFQLNFSLAETNHKIGTIPCIDMRPLPPKGGQEAGVAGFLYMVSACFRN